MEGEDVGGAQRQRPQHRQRRDQRVVGLDVDHVPALPGHLAPEPRREAPVSIRRARRGRSGSSPRRAPARSPRGRPARCRGPRPAPRVAAIRRLTSITWRSTPPWASGLRGVTIRIRGRPSGAILGLLGAAAGDPVRLAAGAEVAGRRREEAEDDRRRPPGTVEIAAAMWRRGRTESRAAGCGERRSALRRARRHCRRGRRGSPSSVPRPGIATRSRRAWPRAAGTKCPTLASGS